ncbi:MAG: hypothetical protein A2X23_13775 [Chloroflexi bacterium GWC2_73_18]|nr:MAG: hypothetical protein A2X23_13775 [Chloroflexi bacterium GWC2_73_18]
MDELGRAIGRAFGDLSSAVGNVGDAVATAIGGTLAELDRMIHSVLPAEVPGWVVGAVAALAALAFLGLRR